MEERMDETHEGRQDEGDNTRQSVATKAYLDTDI